MTDTPIDREKVERLANIVQKVDAPFAHKTKVVATLCALRDALDEAETERDRIKRQHDILRDQMARAIDDAHEAQAELQKFRFEAVANKSQILALSEELGEARARAATVIEEAAKEADKVAERRRGTDRGYAAEDIASNIRALASDTEQDALPPSKRKTEMGEICTPPHIEYDDNGDEIVTFTSNHSWGDVVRWICRSPADRETVMILLKRYHDGWEN